MPSSWRGIQNLAAYGAARKAQQLCMCLQWAVAASAATVSLDLPTDKRKHPWPSTFPRRVKGLQPWLQQHARQLVSIKLTPALSYWSELEKPQLQLPCAELQQLSSLQLEGVDLAAPEDISQQDSCSSGSQPVPPVLPKLIELQLVGCSISFTFLAQMLQLTGISHLNLQDVHTTGGGSLVKLDVYSTMLPRLPKLVHLGLSYHSGYAPPTKMFPSSLTALGLQGDRSDYPYRLTQLAHLRKLDLSHIKFNPLMISNMSQLLHLQLDFFTLLSPNNGGEGADSAAALLEAIGSMRQLEHLSIYDDENTWLSQHVQAHQFSALTASTHLTHLDLNCGNEQPLPAQAARHMFPAGKQFPKLQQVIVFADESCAGAGFISSAELCNIVSACPSISSLNVTCVLHPDADIHALLQLPPTCRSLGIGGEGLDDAAAVVVAQLTQLTRLSWTQSSDLSDAGLDRLTALQALEDLSLQELHGLSDGVVPKYDGFMEDEFSLTAGDQPVWQQLHDKIRSASCNASWSHRLDSLAQVREQEASTAKLQLDALSSAVSYMDHALVAMTCCAGSAEVMQSVRSMVDLGRKVLSGAGAGDVAGAGPGVAGLAQQYRELQEPVQQFCRDSSSSSSQEVMDALSSMEAAVLQAVEGAV